MLTQRVIGILICLVPLGLAIVWLEVYALRLEQKVADMADRYDRLTEVNARLRARLASEIGPEMLVQAFGDGETEDPLVKPDPGTGAPSPTVARSARLTEQSRATPGSRPTR